MARWILKAAGARALSALPGSRRWHYLAQRRVTRSLRVDADDFALRLGRCRKHLEDYLARAPSQANDFTVLELGTGWFPFTPIGLFLCGAGTVVTVDKEPFLRRLHVEHALDRLMEAGRAGQLKIHLPQFDGARFERLQRVRARSLEMSVGAMLGALGIEVRVGDVREAELASGTVDLICSDGTLQAIPEQQLADILVKFRQFAKDSAVMSHEVAMKDAFAVFDRSIGPLNYLKFSDGTWRVLGQPLNRLRASDFRRLHERAGWRVIGEEDVELARAETLAGLRLAPRFQRYESEDLRVIRSRIVSVPDEPLS